MEISEIYNKLTDKELIKAINEIKDCENNGYFDDNSTIRELCRETSKITQMNVSSNLMMVQIGVLKEAAYRWIDLLNK